MQEHPYYGRQAMETIAAPPPSRWRRLRRWYMRRWPAVFWWTGLAALCAGAAWAISSR